MTTAHNQSSQPNEDEQLLTKEEEIQYGLSDPDAANAVQLLLLLGYAYNQKDHDARKAFRFLKQEGIEKTVLTPEGYLTFKASLEVAKKELTKQTKNGKRDYAQIDLGPFKQTISLEELERFKHVDLISSHIHQTLGKEEFERKLQNANNIYGLNEENAVKLKNLVAQDRENGISFEEALNKNATQLHTDQAIGVHEEMSDEEKKQKGEAYQQKHGKELKEKKQALNDTNKTVYEQVRKDHQPILERGEEINRRLMDKNTPPASEEELQRLISYVEKGKTPHVPFDEKNTQERLAGGFSEIDDRFAAEMMGQDLDDVVERKKYEKPSIGKRPPPQGSAQPRTPIHISIPQPIQNAFLNIMSFTNKAKGLVNNYIFAPVKNFLKDTAIKIGTRLLGKAIVGSILTGATGGVFGVAMAASELVKRLTLGLVNPEAIVWNGVKYVIIGLVVFLFLAPFFMTELFVPGKIISIALGPSQQRTISWKEFEETFLSYKEKRGGVVGDWTAFEKDHLLPQTIFFSYENLFITNNSQLTTNN